MAENHDTSLIGEEAFTLANSLMKDSLAAAQIAEVNIKNEKKEVWRVTAAIQHNLQVHIWYLCQLHLLTMNSINNLAAAIDKLPNEQQFREVKDELSQHRENVINTLTPIKKMAESYEEYRKRMEQGNETGSIQ